MGFGALGSRLQAPGSRLQAPGSRLQAPGSRLQAPGSRLQAPSSRLQAPGFRLQAPGSRSQAPGSRLQAPGSRLHSRLQAPGSRLQAPGSKPQASKSRLPQLLDLGPPFSVPSMVIRCKARAHDKLQFGKNGRIGERGTQPRLCESHGFGSQGSPPGVLMTARPSHFPQYGSTAPCVEEPGGAQFSSA